MDSFVAPLQGLFVDAVATPRAVPWADMLRPLQGSKQDSPRLRLPMRNISNWPDLIIRGQALIALTTVLRLQTRLNRSLAFSDFRVLRISTLVVPES
jgi:hypothetical protein